MKNSVNKIILCANPSHQTSLEKIFWQNFKNLAKNKGWELFTIAARSGEFDLVLPARLYQVQNYLNGYYPKNKSLLPEWLDSKYFEIIVNWEYKRWEELHDKSAISAGLIKLSWFVDFLIREMKPAVVITTNKIDHGCLLYKLAGEFYEAKYYFIERSPFDSIWVESKGMFAESDIYDFVKSIDYNDKNRSMIERHGERVIEQVKLNPDGFRKQDIGSIDLPLCEGPIVFFPIDNALWTGLAQEDHPQKMVDYYNDFSNVDEIISTLLKYVTRRRGLLLIKKHPADLEKYEAENLFDQNIKLISGSLEPILKRVDIVVCQNTKIAYVSNLLEIPTVVLSPNTASILPGVQSVKTKLKLIETLDKSLDENPVNLIDKNLRNFIIGKLDKSFFYSANKTIDNSKQNIYHLLERITIETSDKNIISVFPQLNELISNLKTTFNKNLIIEMESLKMPYRLIIFFDISRLINDNLYHSGINRFARNLLHHLLQEDSVDIVPVFENDTEIKNLQRSSNHSEFLSQFNHKPVSVESINSYRFKESEKYLYYSPYSQFPKLLNSINNLTKIITVHDILHITKSELYANPKTYTGTTKIVESISKNDICICVSEYTRMDLIRHSNVYPENTFVVPLAADDEFKIIRDDSNSKNFLKRIGVYKNKYLVCLAQDDPRKNLSATVVALEEVLIQNKDVKLVFIASEVRKQNIMNEYEILKDNSDRIIFISNLNDSELAALYNHATAFIYASLAEGFGLPIIEAISCGCPVITSSLTSIPSVATDCALYVDPRNVTSIIDAVNLLLRSPSLVEQIKTNILRISGKYTWKDVAQNYLAVFKLLSKSKLDEIIYNYDNHPKHKKSEIIYRLFPYSESNRTPANFEPINSIVSSTKYYNYQYHRLNSIDIIENNKSTSKGVKLQLERSFEESYNYHMAAFLKREKRNKAYISVVVNVNVNEKIIDNQKVTLYFDLENGTFDGIYYTESLVNCEIKNVNVYKIYDDLVFVEFILSPGNAIKFSRLEIGPKESDKPTIIYLGKRVLSIRLINFTIRRF